mmetsp:Transcript_56974/g.94535  ORF Transcript_56974/g.94535 Transcript_56974/m.94535 type:complete len:108 (+) Transcript_56974:157-480(+)
MAARFYTFKSKCRHFSMNCKSKSGRNGRWSSACTGWRRPSAVKLISTRRQFPCWKEYYTKMMPQQVPGGFEEARVPASKSELQFMKHPVQNEEQEEIRKLSWFTGSF